MVYNIKAVKKCRCGGIGRRKGLKIPRWQHRIGSSPISGTKKREVMSFALFCFPKKRKVCIKKDGFAAFLAFFFLFVNYHVSPVILPEVRLILCG